MLKTDFTNVPAITKEQTEEAREVKHLYTKHVLHDRAGMDQAKAIGDKLRAVRRQFEKNDGRWNAFCKVAGMTRANALNYIKISKNWGVVRGAGTTSVRGALAAIEDAKTEQEEQGTPQGEEGGRKARFTTKRKALNGRGGKEKQENKAEPTVFEQFTQAYNAGHKKKAAGLLDQLKGELVPDAEEKQEKQERREASKRQQKIEKAEEALSMIEAKFEEWGGGEEAMYDLFATVRGGIG